MTGQGSDDKIDLPTETYIKSAQDPETTLQGNVDCILGTGDPLGLAWNVAGRTTEAYNDGMVQTRELTPTQYNPMSSTPGVKATSYAGRQTGTGVVDAIPRRHFVIESCFVWMQLTAVSGKQMTGSLLPELHLTVSAVPITAHNVNTDAISKMK